jgi:hypothetical protein
MRLTVPLALNTVSPAIVRPFPIMSGVIVAGFTVRDDSILRYSLE